MLLTVQVDAMDGDQLVQFRSLQDIWAVRKTWVRPPTLDPTRALTPTNLTPA